MNIWIDADACPVVIRDIIVKAANRTKIPTTFLANHYLKLPPSPLVSFKQVSSGFDEADNEIVRLCQPGDLVISSDIPLANDVIEKGAFVITSRGEQFTKENIKAKLNMRDFMDTMRSSGMQSGGQAPLSQADRMAFSNELDKVLTRYLKQIKR